jgi:hypothetical protein
MDISNDQSLSWLVGQGLCLEFVTCCQKPTSKDTPHAHAQ